MLSMLIIYYFFTMYIKNYLVKFREDKNVPPPITMAYQIYPVLNISDGIALKQKSIKLFRK